MSSFYYSGVFQIKMFFLLLSKPPCWQMFEEPEHILVVYCSLKAQLVDIYLGLKSGIQTHVLW